QSNTMFMPYPLNHTALTLSYTLSLHDALPICRTSPRTKVPAGSVAVAGDFSAVYPSDSPGGWQLLGVTDIPMWDLSRPEPAYIQPGFRVQFRNADTVSVPVSMPAALPGGTDPQSVKAGSLAAEVRADADE